MGLTDCYTKHGIWQIEEAEEQGGQRGTLKRNGVKECIK
jgi:hypothetical protein